MRLRSKQANRTSPWVMQKRTKRDVFAQWVLQCPSPKGRKESTWIALWWSSQHPFLYCFAKGRSESWNAPWWSKHLKNVTLLHWVGVIFLSGLRRVLRRVKSLPTDTISKGFYCLTLHQRSTLGFWKVGHFFCVCSRDWSRGLMKLRTCVTTELHPVRTFAFIWIRHSLYNELYPIL